MKRTIIIAAIAALALAGCNKESKDDQNEISENETLEFPEEIVPYLEYYSGSFHGECTVYNARTMLSETAYDDMTFTPYSTPKKVSGVIDATVYGEMSSSGYSINSNGETISGPVTYTCYYSMAESTDGEEAVYFYFYEYDPDTGLTLDKGMENLSVIVDADSFQLLCCYWEYKTNSYLYLMEYIRL